MVAAARHRVPARVWIDEQGEPQGIAIEIGKILASDLGVRPEWVNVPWEEQFAALFRGDVDLVPKPSLTPARRIWTRSISARQSDGACRKVNATHVAAHPIGRALLAVAIEMCCGRSCRGRRGCSADRCHFHRHNRRRKASCGYRVSNQGCSGRMSRSRSKATWSYSATMPWPARWPAGPLRRPAPRRGE